MTKLHTFCEQLQCFGLDVSNPVADAKLHRLKVAGDKGEQKSGWYILFDHGDFYIGEFGDWRTGLHEKWTSKDFKSFTEAERKTFNEEMNLAKKAREAAESILHDEIQAKALKIWNSARNATTKNAYVQRKGINPLGCKQFGNTDTLIIPVCDSETEAGGPEIVSLQFISPEGTKKFLTGGKKKGCYYAIGNPDSKFIVICEGFATGASIAQATNYLVLIAFDAGNLLPVAQRISSKASSQTRIIIASDNDVWGDANIGVQKATEASSAINAYLVTPDFTHLDLSQKPTDFNDLHQLAGLEEVARQINLALPSPTPEPSLALVQPIKPSKLSKSIGVDTVSLDQVKMEPIDWLMNGWLPLGKLTLLAGQAGTGKTQLAISLASMLSAGQALPDGTNHSPLSILMWSGEDDITTVITPRFKAAQAQMNRIHLVQGVTDAKGQYRPFDFALDLPSLKEKAHHIGDIGLIIIDPLVSVVAGDSNKASDVRAGLQPIVEMAQELNCAVIGITHYRKGSNSQNVSDDVLGSQAYIAVPRVAWGTKRKDSDNSCVVAIIKNNLAPLIGGFEYVIESQIVFNDIGKEIPTSRIVWGEYREETASQLFRDFPADTGDDSDLMSEPSKLLIDLLKDGSSRKVSEIKQLLEARPTISWRSIERSANALKVARVRTNTFPSETFWSLPPISPYLMKQSA